MSGHTPGPWVVESDGYYPVVRKIFSSYHHMNVCGPIHGYMYSGDEAGQQAANARLIASAPELLEALRSLVQNLTEGDFISEERLSAAVDAIAKATGDDQGES